MVVSGDEVIDAGRRGGLGRHINHSCEPNCAAEKWKVEGETCVGIFALRDIPAGTELSFDYKVELVGMEAQACHCGAEACRGLIGAKPADSGDEVIPDGLDYGTDEDEEREMEPPPPPPSPPRTRTGPRPRATGLGY